MHGVRIATTAAAFVVAAVFAVSAGAHGIPTTGDQITLGNCVASPCTSTYAANEPFFVRQGFVTNGTDEDRRSLLDPRTRFELTVDGERVPAALDLDLNADPPSKLYITNFRFGMTGTHTLEGCWYSDGELQFCGTRSITFTE